jgi:phosphoglycerol transferase MdoB-like AlkP superfamily enzyme
VNLIVYLVESFMDPDDLGIRFTADPIPTVRALRRSQIGGYAIVPHEFGGSADTEFELLSGMSTSFLPEGSVAYRSYLTRPIPSMSGLLRELGYTTTAVQADPKHYYERQRAYGLLGFDHMVWLGDSAGVERAPRGLWPSDASVVSAVIQATQPGRPAFVFAFPSSTHFPYGRGTYRNSTLDALDVPAADATAEVKEYVNALRDADQAIGTLIDHFRRQPDSTIIAVLGDHLPPLPEGALRTFLGRQTGMSPLERARMRRRVPLLIWANFPIPRRDMELSTNLLPSYLLHLLGVAPPAPWLAINDALRQRLPVLSTYAQGPDGLVRDRAAVPGPERALVEDYRLLQYDLLLGEQYALRPGARTASACGEERGGGSVTGP